MQDSLSSTDSPERAARVRTQRGAFKDASDARTAVERLASDQVELYRRQPGELIGHANREIAAIDSL